MTDSGVEVYAFTMKLRAGQEQVYRQRHDAIWPDLVEELRRAGVLDYRIYLEPQTLVLFAFLQRRADHSMEALKDSASMRRWWAMMSDIMETNVDLSPRIGELLPMFHLSAPQQLRSDDANKR